MVALLPILVALAELVLARSEKVLWLVAEVMEVISNAKTKSVDVFVFLLNMTLL